MPYLITRTWYPSTKARELGKLYLEAMKKYPPDESLGKLVVQFAVTSTKRGLETISITLVENPKLGDAFERQANFMAQFLDVEGVTYEIKTWGTAEEGLRRLGLV